MLWWLGMKFVIKCQVKIAWDIIYFSGCLFFFLVIANIMFIEVDNVLVAITSFDHFYLRWGMLCDHKYYKDCANANRESIKKLTWWMFKEIIKKRHEDFIWRYVDK
jgi:hypothetical protein